MELKNCSKTAFLVLAALVWILSCSQSGSESNTPQKPSGTDVGGGGDHYTSEFRRIGYEILELIIQAPVPDVKAEDLRKAIDSTEVVSFEQVYLHNDPNQLRDAINFPHSTPPRIEMSRISWDRMKPVRHEKIFLVFHEYLGILGIDDTKYQISHQLDRANVCFRTEPIRFEIERQVRKSCYRISVDDLKFIEALSLYQRGITEIKRGDFAYLYGLQILYLYTNSIRTVPPGVFADLGSLQELALAFNKLEYLQENAFEGLKSLTRLDLIGNEILTCHPKAFAGLEKLTEEGLWISGQFDGKNDADHPITPPSCKLLSK